MKIVSKRNYMALFGFKDKIPSYLNYCVVYIGKSSGFSPLTLGELKGEQTTTTVYREYIK